MSILIVIFILCMLYIPWWFLTRAIFGMISEAYHFENSHNDRFVSSPFVGEAYFIGWIIDQLMIFIDNLMFKMVTRLEKVFVFLSKIELRPVSFGRNFYHKKSKKEKDNV